MAPLQDFIPAGQSSGAVGKGGFSDFVPSPVPEFHEAPVEVKEEKPKRKSKKVEALGEPEAPVAALEAPVEVKE